jgi:hypothetical protein
MSYKIYLIKHLDTDMKYVGITSQTMQKRFMQHGSDRMGALYKIMRTDKSRMQIELIEEVFDKMEALKKEQEYIRIFDTAEPRGWNRQVTDWQYGPALTFGTKIFNNNPKKWRRQNGVAEFAEGSVLACPKCSYQYTHQEKIEVYEHEFHVTVKHRNITTDANVMENPATRSGEALRYFIKCESCHGDWLGGHPDKKDSHCPPLFEFIIYQHKGRTFFETVYYIEDNS